MRPLVLTPKFKRAFRKFVKRNADLQKRIEATLEQMETDVFAPNLGTHKLSGTLDGLQSCSCGYDCRIFRSSRILNQRAKLLCCLILVHMMKFIKCIASASVRSLESGIASQLGGLEYLIPIQKM